MPDASLAAIYLADVVRTYKNYKGLGEAAIAQVPAEAQLHEQLDADANSIAIIVKHLAGNLESRFRDFLTSDGEKPDRHRDGEFEMPERASREQMLAWWNRGWGIALDSIQALTPGDVLRTVHIRGEPFAVVEALNRSVTHTAYHVGQIVELARHFAYPNWKSLSIPKGRSGEFTKGDFKTRGMNRTT